MNKTPDISDIRTRADIEPILKEIVEVLVRDYQPETIILYGSYAYGNPTRHSDIDLFIVKETDEDDIARFVTVKRIIFKPGRGISVQPNIYTPAELKDRQRLGDYFIEDVFEKGKVLFSDGKRPQDSKRRVVRNRRPQPQ